MNKRTVLFLIGVLAILGPAAGAALAQGSAAIEWWVLGSGGGPSSGSTVAINDTLGQPIVGLSSGGGAALGAGYWYDASVPTAVELAWFTATARDSAVVLAWETASEVDLLGFNVYRAEAEGGVRTRLNEALIPAQAPGSPMGAVYDLVDEAVAPGATYWYWLAALDLHGEATARGPVSATAGEPGYDVYLPLVNK